MLAAGLATAAAASGQTSGCQVPDAMTAQQKLTCLQTAKMLLDQPELTPTQITNGPDFDPRDPEKSKIFAFTADSTIACYFRPHYAFAKVPGDSMKFQCWQMTPQGGFYSTKGDPIQASAVKVVISK